MIVVTGTKRSGTSMWMQLMNAAGIPVIGEKFMRNWETTIRDANPHGFYESPLRRGLYYRTNPDPRSGMYLTERDMRGQALKVFIPGLVRTERAYIERVVATMRNWREYGASLSRLHEMESESRRATGKERSAERVRMPPVLEWWRENYMLMRDVAIRQYPVFMVSYDNVVSNPSEILPRVFTWLGAGDGAAAIAHVDADVRTQRAATIDAPEDVEPEIAEVFDEFYGRIHEGVAIDAPFIERLNATDEALQERIAQAMAHVRVDALARRREQRKLRRERAAIDEGSHEEGLDADEPLMGEAKHSRVDEESSSHEHGLDGDEDV